MKVLIEKGMWAWSENLPDQATDPSQEEVSIGQEPLSIGVDW